MTDATLLADVAETLRQAAKIPAGVAIAPESSLVDDLNIDSLDLVNVLLKMQDRFDVVIEDDDVPNLRRVSDLARYVLASRGSAAA